jgi:DNA-binding beta-propeller fold protein YncE
VVFGSERFDTASIFHFNLSCATKCVIVNRIIRIKSVRGIYFSIFLVSVMGVGQTVAGYCNATGGNGSSELHGPWGIYVSPYDGTLYVADWDLGRCQSFAPFSRTGYIFASSGLIQPEDVFADSSNTLYITDAVYNNGIAYVQQAGTIVRSFPAPGLSTSSCKLNGLDGAYGIAVDRSGNIYISLYWCYAVVKWAPNATNGTVAAGQLGVEGSSSSKLSGVRFIYLDDDRGMLYVADSGNNRIQRFAIGGNGTGVTVAGSSSAGTGLNQLNSPGGVWVTRDGLTLFIADYGNNRVMKWTIGATQGSLVAGSLSGASGQTAQLLNYPGDVALDPTETYLYVSDYGNHRVQRFCVS